MKASKRDPALRPLLAAILFLVPLGGWAQEWIRVTDRGQNPLVVEAMQSGSLQEALEASRALGQREDPFISDVISALLAADQQLILQFLLQEAFPPSAPAEALRARLAVNREGLDELASRLADFGPALRRETVRLFRASALAAYDREVFALAAQLERRMRAQKGLLEAEQGELALEVLEYAASRRNPDFLDLVLRLQESSRDQPVARKAAAVARRLLEPLRRASGNPAGS
jgi:hypothetical protein